MPFASAGDMNPGSAWDGIGEISYALHFWADSLFASRDTSVESGDFSPRLELGRNRGSNKIDI
jgi:hypothetical protein